MSIILAYAFYALVGFYVGFMLTLLVDTLVSD